jgi:hypothetical protein
LNYPAARLTDSARATKACTKPVRRNQYRFLLDLGQLVLVLDQICSIAQLFSPRLRAKFERKLKYEIAPKIATFVPRHDVAPNLAQTVGAVRESRLANHDSPVANRRRLSLIALHLPLVTAQINRQRNIIESQCKSLETTTSDPNQSLVFVVFFTPGEAKPRAPQSAAGHYKVKRGSTGKIACATM